MPHMEPSNRRTMLRTFVPLTVLVLIGGLYVSALDNPMVMEDQPAIAANPLVIGSCTLLEAWVSPSYAPPGDAPVRYQPVNLLSYQLNHRLMGMSPIGFRLVNIGLLGILGLMVIGWLYQHTDYPAAPVLAALLFVAHPSNAESINHLIGRGELLAMIGVVGFAWVQRLALTRMVAEQDQPERAPGFWGTLLPLAVHTLLSSVFAVVALFSSPTGLVVVPLAVIQPFLFRRKQHPFAARQARALVVGGWLLLGITVWLYFEGWKIVMDMAHTDRLVGGAGAHLDEFATNPLSGLPFVDRLPSALWLAWFYARQIFAPDTHMWHDPVDLPSWGTPGVYLGLGMLVVATVSLGVGLYRRRWGVLGLVLVFSQYVMVSNLPFLRVQYASNLWMMPFTLGAALIVARWIDRATEPVAGKRSSRKLAVAVIPSGVAIILMAMGVWNVNQRWFSSARIMAWELSKRPDVPALMYRYGRALTEVGAYTRARFWLEAAMLQRPDSVQIRHALALTHLMMGDPLSASDQYLKITEIAPDDCAAQTQVAALAISDADPELAQIHLAQARLVCPHDPDVMYNVARLAEALEQPDLAIEAYERLLRRWPDHLVGQSDLARLRGEVTDPVE